MAERAPYSAEAIDGMAAELLGKLCFVHIGYSVKHEGDDEVSIHTPKSASQDPVDAVAPGFFVAPDSNDLDTRMPLGVYLRQLDANRTGPEALEEAELHFLAAAIQRQWGELQAIQKRRKEAQTTWGDLYKRQGAALMQALLEHGSPVIVSTEGNADVELGLISWVEFKLGDEKDSQRLDPFIEGILYSAPPADLSTDPILRRWQIEEIALGAHREGRRIAEGGEIA